MDGLGLNSLGLFSRKVELDAERMEADECMDNGMPSTHLDCLLGRKQIWRLENIGIYEIGLLFAYGTMG